MSSIYIVRVNETVRDVVINTTGTFTLFNWDLIMKANAFDSWTPSLNAGDQVIIPDGIAIDKNTFQDKSAYPASNGTVPGYLGLLQIIWNIILDRWILRTGYWDDSGIWIDTDKWID